MPHGEGQRQLTIRTGVQEEEGGSRSGRGEGSAVVPGQLGSASGGSRREAWVSGDRAWHAAEGVRDRFLPSVFSP